MNPGFGIAVLGVALVMTAAPVKNSAVCAWLMGVGLSLYVGGMILTFLWGIV